MIQFRKFSKFDWMTFSGATLFRPDQAPGEDREPYVAEFKVDGEECVVILDADNLAVLMGNDEEVTKELRLPFARAALAIIAMKPEMTKAELEAMGFKS